MSAKRLEQKGYELEQNDTKITQEWVGLGIKGAAELGDLLIGIRGFANMEGANSKTVSKNALPILAYYDIFKNYYANTQEENFYIIHLNSRR